MADKKDDKKKKDVESLDVEMEANIEGLAKTALEKKKKDEKQKKKADSTVITFKKRYDIFVHKKLELLSNDLVTAYEVRDNNNPEQKKMAFICRDDLPARRRNIKAFSGVNHKCIASLSDKGFVKWTDGIERYVLVFENIYGRAVMSRTQTSINPFSTDVLVEVLIKPFCELLKSFAEKGFVHGAIRPSNLFYSTLDGGKSFAINPCLAYPLGYDEDVLYEPIEIAMSDPAGKGGSCLKNDLYALGVTLAILIIGHNPLASLSPREVVEGKIKYGTFSLLLGRQRISSALNEVLRGLLVDDAANRWDVHDLVSWCDGNRQTPRQSTPEAKADRPFTFKDKEYTSMRLLARDLFKNPKEAFAIICNGSLHKWVDRTVGDAVAAERYNQAVMHASLDSSSESRAMHTVLAKVLVALDPTGPIRYSGYCFMPDALPQVLTELVYHNKDQEVFLSIVFDELVKFWCSFNSESVFDPKDVINSLNRCREYLRKRSFCNGIERCVYFLNRDLQCLSPYFKNYYVGDSTGVLIGLQKVYNDKLQEKEPFDKHIGGFLAVHFSGSREGDIQLLGSANLSERYYAALTLFASIQNFSEIKSFKNVCTWMLHFLPHTVTKLKSVKLQKELIGNLKKASLEGSLITMLDIINDQSVAKKDILGFSQAKLAFEKLSKEKKLLELKLEKDDMGMSEGRQVTAIIAIVISMIAFIVFLMMIY